MKISLKEGKNDSVRELKKVLLEIKKTTKALNENKNSLKTNKQLLENLKKYKKIGTRYLGYKVLLEGWFTDLTQATRGAGNSPTGPRFKTPMPKSGDQDFKLGTIKKKIRIFKEVLKQIINENAGNEIYSYVADTVLPLLSKASKILEDSDSSSFALEKSKLDEIAWHVGNVTDFLSGYVMFFKDKESGNVKEALKALSSSRAFSKDRGLDKKKLESEIMDRPEILDINKNIAITSKLIDIPEFVKASTSFFKSPLQSIGDFFSSALDGGNAGGGGGLFGRKPQE